MLTNKEIVSYVFGEAAKSNSEKRKVGCLITVNGKLGGLGYNTEVNGKCVHAEVNAVLDVMHRFENLVDEDKIIAYVSHQPCPDCAKYILQELGEVDIQVVAEFMKFDGDKLRYDLVPPVFTEGVAAILTFGARKYKPNNWQNCEDPERYVAALFRHIEAWRAGETLDKDSGMHHLAHAATNIAFLMHLDYQPKQWTKAENSQNLEP